MRVLVTGAGGRIGRAVVRRLTESGHLVVGAGRKPPSIAGLERHISVELGSPAAAAELADGCPPCEGIVHAAACLSMAPDDPHVTRANCLGTHQMINVGRAWGCRRFVFLSSLPVIGVPVRLPVTEDHPVAPRTVYHASKLFGEHLVAIVGGTSLRVTSPIGPIPADGRIFSTFVQRARDNEPLILAGRGGRRQNFVDVRDIAAAVERSLLRAVPGVFNIAGTEAVSNLRLAEECVKVLGSCSPIAFSGAADPDEDLSWDVSANKADSQLGWRCRYSLADSISAAAEGVER